MISDLRAWRLSDFSTLMQTLGRLFWWAETTELLAEGASEVVEVGRWSRVMYSPSKVSPKAPPPMRRTMVQRLRTTSPTLRRGGACSSPLGLLGSPPLLLLLLLLLSLLI